MIRLISFDMDGTILRSDKTISNYTSDTIQKLIDRGIRILPNTGRCLDASYSFFTSIKGFDYIGCNNGSRLVDIRTMENCWSSCLDSETALNVFTILQDYGIKPLVFLGDVFYRSVSDETVNRKVISRTLEVSPKIAEEIKKQGIKSVIESNKYPIYKVSGRLPDLSIKPALIKQLEKIENISYCNALPTNIEVSTKEASKGKVLQLVMDYYGIRKEEVLAIGDGNNDIEMFKVAGHSVAMKNGDPEIFAYADSITEYCEDEDGAARIFEEMILK